ncbi:MAG TPA: hypothetical protein VMS92_04685 [Mycobacterium sp.]|nr:hypothetical protein [Mycobacterium sp.]
MAATHHRRRFVLTTAAAAAVAVSLSACTAVVHGAAVAGDRGPCTHVGTPMLDVPANSSTEPQIRIPQPLGWERTPELEQDGPSSRLALSDDDAAVIVMVRSIPEDDPAIIFDNFYSGMLIGAEQEGLSADLTRTPSTVCGLPSETVSVAVADPAMGGAPNALPSDDPFKTVVVVAESGGDTYLIAVVQVGGSEGPAQQSEAETVLSGIEVLPQDATAA